MEKMHTDDEIIAQYMITRTIKGAARALDMDRNTVRRAIRRIEGTISSPDKMSKSEERYRGSKRTHVITAAQNATDIDRGFFLALTKYCDENDAELHVMKSMYRNPKSSFEAGSLESDDWFHPAVIPFLMDSNLRIADSLIVMGAIRIESTAMNPLASTQMLARGDSAVFASPQLRMQSFPRVHSEHPVVSYTTGCVTVPNFSGSKAGYIADFNHQLSAIVVEVEDDESFHIRDVCYDGRGFYDFDRYYSAIGSVRVKNPAIAFQPGDVHAKFVDSQVMDAFFTGKNSLCRMLKPDHVLLHDLLDAYSISHHHGKKVFTLFAKHVSGHGNLSAELWDSVSVVNTIYDSCGGAEIIVIDSNHNRHFKQFLEAGQPDDMTNLLIWHEMMYLMLKNTRMGMSGAESPDPFKLWCDHNNAFDGRNIRFSYGDVSEKIAGVEMSLHGDIGANGSRGSPQQLSRFTMKVNAGHTHSDCIQFGYRSAGTMSYLRLEYNNGPSSWTHGAVITYRNGERQNIRCVKGRYRASWK